MGYKPQFTQLHLHCECGDTPQLHGTIPTCITLWSVLFSRLIWQVAAQSLADVADSFHEEGNMIILAAKKMSEQMFQMAEYSHGRGELLVANTLSA